MNLYPKCLIHLLPTDNFNKLFFRNFLFIRILINFFYFCRKIKYLLNFFFNFLFRKFLINEEFIQNFLKNNKIVGEIKFLQYFHLNNFYFYEKFSKKILIFKKFLISRTFSINLI